MTNPLRGFHRWIDLAWVDQGLLNANPQFPPWRLELLPIAIVGLVMITDLLSLNETARIWLIPAFLLAGLLHLYFGWRLIYLTSMTQISQKITRGEEPDPNDVLNLTE